MAEPTFSVIVPTYGRPRFLAEAVASVLAQTEPDLECLVIDDASREPVEAPGDPRVRVLRHRENRGVAEARNTGLRGARGRIVAFLDDDDLYAPHRLALAREGLARAPVTICWRGNAADAGPVRNRTLEGSVYDTILEAEVPHLGQVSVWREAVRPFDGALTAGEDTEWWLAMSREHPVSTVPKVGFMFRRHAGPRHGNTMAARIRARRDLLDRHAAYFEERPRAHAYQWMHIGIVARRLGDFRLARAAFARSFRIRRDPAMLWHVARSMRPSAPPVLAGPRA
jgi:glycosyltransferase involved in cell wall biosynthesis